MDVISQYTAAANKSHLELEIRFGSITRDVFLKIAAAMKTGAALECTLNVIINAVDDIVVGKMLTNNSSLINRITFVGGEKKKEECIVKTRLKSTKVPNAFMPHSVTLSSEEPCDLKKITSLAALARFKRRLSMKLTDKWRADLTIVHDGQMKKLGSSLPAIRDKMFPPRLTVDNFTEPSGLYEKYEFELEYIGAAAPTAEDLTIVNRIFQIVDARFADLNEYSALVNMVAAAIKQKPTGSLKRTMNQVVALSKSMYYTDVFPPVNYFVTIKADGVRTVVVNDRGKMHFLTSAGLESFASDIPGLLIADTEVVDIEGERRVYVFDVIAIDGENIADKPFRDRVGSLLPAAKQIEAISKIAAEPKDYIQLPAEMNEEVEINIDHIYNGEEYPFEIDGIIFTSPDDSYSATMNYKWKPIEQQTIDFLVRRCPDSLRGTVPYIPRDGYDLYLLFVGIRPDLRIYMNMPLISRYESIFPDISSRDYIPIQFSPSADPLAHLYYAKSSDISDLDGRICELRRTINYEEEVLGDWEFVRFRDDRGKERNYYGNDFRIAELTYMNYIDEFKLEDLWTENSSYFTKNATSMYSASNKFKRFIVSSHIQNLLREADYIIDLGSGRGADLMSYANSRVKHCMFVDIDRTALVELISRKHKYFGGNAKYNPRLGVSVMVADLTKPSTDLFLNFGVREGSVNGFVCNFALHYMCRDLSTIKNVLETVSRLLKPGGVFIFSVMDGEEVNNVLSGKPRGYVYEMLESAAVKYAIRKEYDGDKLLNFGQQIAVKLPFADEMYSEPLCNVKHFADVAKKYKLVVEVSENFTKYFSNFETRIGPRGYILTDIDKDYAKLHRLVILRKM